MPDTTNPSEDATNEDCVTINDDFHAPAYIRDMIGYGALSLLFGWLAMQSTGLERHQFLSVVGTCLPIIAASLFKIFKKSKFKIEIRGNSIVRNHDGNTVSLDDDFIFYKSFIWTYGHIFYLHDGNCVGGSLILIIIYFFSAIAGIFQIIASFFFFIATQKRISPYKCAVLYNETSREFITFPYINGKLNAVVEQKIYPRIKTKGGNIKYTLATPPDLKPLYMEDI